ncbi:disheveled-associated activator of morphogenesis 1-like isoform X2 [Hydractinia symbiolongicarpus]|uniref:disheveled-associated activator of morphogenesis 1-like isoform X2 n=1 Tax=Hydractinia symbiolongicarpus TaxID=13093 RepID=UPI00254FF913|nr:disheveled-associated activator of morphogenesis 1-like isoform X2 [Hydractinia symbiolongicarpus]
MPKKKGGLFSCFGGGTDEQPEIRYEPEGVNLQAREHDVPMPDISELDEKFTELVDDLDLTAVHRKAMFDLSPEKKWQIYCSRNKGQNVSAGASPEYYIQRLNALNSMYYQKTEEEILERTRFLEELKTALRTQPMSFVQSFLNNDGLQCLIDVLANMDWETCESTIHTACIGCLKALMNNSNGRSEVLAHPNCINIITQSLITENLKTKTAVLEILGACCLVPGGHKKVLDAMCHFQQYAEERTRFQTIINDLDRSTGFYRDEFGSKIAIMSFINAALRYGAGADHLEFRIHLRYEFLMLGLHPIMEKLKKLDNLTLDRHIDFFDMVRNEDEKELAKRYGIPQIDAKSASSMLDVLKQKIGHTTCYVHLLSILQHLLLLPVDHKKGAIDYWRIVDRIIQEVAIQQEDGTDPDAAPVDIHVKYIIDKMTTDDFKDDTVSKLAKRESEMAEMRNTIDKMADKLDKETKAQEELKTKYEDLLAKAQKLEQSLNLETVSRMKLEEVVKEVGASIPDDAKIANLASMGALPPSMLLAASESVLSPAAAPPPPPPAGFAPPPPPPMFGAPGAPPPPPMMGGMGNNKKKSKLPKPSQPLKSFNWAKLPDVKLKGTIWSDLDESTVIPYLEFHDIDEKFSAYQKKEMHDEERKDHNKAEDDEDGISVLNFKPKELSFIDNRRAQNCQILLRKINLGNDEIASCLLSMDTDDKLSRDMVEQMLKFVPTADEANLFKSHENDAHQFARADRYLYEMSKIPHFEQRLKALFYKKGFSERVAEVKPKIEGVIRSCKQVSRSKRLRTLLELVLCLGNYMNKGSRGNASGFRVSSLNKIIDTKSSTDRRITLLHYILELLQQKIPHVFNLEEELPDVRNASKVNPADVSKEIGLLQVGIADLEKELTYQSNIKKKDRHPEDKFVETIASFTKVSNFSIQELVELHKDMTERLNKAIILFGDDPKTLSGDEFFGTFSSFLVSFAEAKGDNYAIKKQKEEEAKKARNLAEQREKERQRSAAKKLMTADLSSEDKRKSISERSPGEFDDLISALRTGDVFGDEMSILNKNRKRTGKQRNVPNVAAPKKMSVIERDRRVDQHAIAEML